MNTTHCPRDVCSSRVTSVDRPGYRLLLASSANLNSSSLTTCSGEEVAGVSEDIFMEVRFGPKLGHIGRKFIKSPRLVPFGANLTQIGCQIRHPWLTRRCDRLQQGQQQLSQRGDWTISCIRVSELGTIWSKQDKSGFFLRTFWLGGLKRNKNCSLSVSIQPNMASLFLLDLIFVRNLAKTPLLQTFPVSSRDLLEKCGYRCHVM